MSKRDDLAEIQQWYGERTQPGGVIPFDDVPRGYAQGIVYMGWLIEEIECLRTLELEREKNLQRITELGQEIEILQRNHADGLKVTGIPHEGKVR